MLNVITKKYIIKHTFGTDDLHLSRDAFIANYMSTIYPYPENVKPVAMYWDVYKLTVTIIILGI